jgi:fluoroacetyl-CoA thioesterase
MPPHIEIPLGATATHTQVVAYEQTVQHHYPEMPPVFGTPYLILAMEVAATVAVQPFLPNGWLSVGTMVDIVHLAATPVGATVTATAKLVEVDGYVFTFEVEAHDGTELIGKGRHSRAGIDMARFMKRVEAKAAATPGEHS